MSEESKREPLVIFFGILWLVSWFAGMVMASKAYFDESYIFLGIAIYLILQTIMVAIILGLSDLFDCIERLRNRG